MKLENKEEIAEALKQAVIKLDDLCGNGDNNPFEHVDIRAVLSVMDNAFFYMCAEIKNIESLNGKWNLTNKKEDNGN